MRLARNKMLILFCSLCMVFTLMAPFTASAQDSAAPDIKGHWAEKQLEVWIGKGWIKGYMDGTVKPDGKVTCAEFAALANRSFGLTETGAPPFSDVAASDWFAKDIAVAAARGYLAVYEDGTARPLAYINRTEAASLIARLLDMRIADKETGSSGFADIASIPVQARPIVNMVSSAGLMVGFPDGNFGAEQELTRAQAVTLLTKALDYAASPVRGDMIIAKSGRIVKNLTIQGDLEIAESVGDGHVELHNVTVEGTLYVYGGGGNSVVINDSEVNRIVVLKKGDNVRIVASGSSDIHETELCSGAKLEELDLTGGGFDLASIVGELPEGATVTLDGDFSGITVNTPGVLIVLAPGAAIGTFTLNAAAGVSGEGSIQTAQINAAGVKLTIQPKEVKIAEGVTALIQGAVYPPPAGNGGTVSPPVPPTPPTPPVPPTPLEAINNAANVEALKAALSANALGLGMDGYTGLADFQQNAAVNSLLFARGTGFADKAAVQAALDAALALQFSFKEDYTNPENLNNYEVGYGTWTLENGGIYKLTRSDAENNRAIADNLNAVRNMSLYNQSFMGDFDLKATLKIPVGGPFLNAAVLFNYQDKYNYNYVILNGSNDAYTHGIFRVENNVQTELQDFSTLMDYSQTYQVEISRRGTEITVKINGEVWGVVNDNTFRTGKIGFGSRNTTVEYSQLEFVGTKYQDIADPLAPTGMAAKVNTAGQVKLTWEPAMDDVGIQSYRIYCDSQLVGTTSSTTYIDSIFKDGVTHQYAVEAVDFANKVSPRTTVVEATSKTADGKDFGFSEKNLQKAFQAPLLAYTRAPGVFEWAEGSKVSGTALYYLTYMAQQDPDIWGPDGTTVTGQALGHIRNLISGGKEIGASGSGLNGSGYNVALQALVLAEHTPAIRDGLTAAEKNKLALLFKAALAGAKWAFDDGNDFDTGIDLEGNFGKGWNPGYVEGGIGPAVAAAIFLGADQAKDFLANFSYDAFLAELTAAGFTNIIDTYRATNAPGNGKTNLILETEAAKKAKVEASIKGTFTYKGHSLDELHLWAKELVTYMWSLPVQSEAVRGSQRAYLIAGVEDLPNIGLTGMATEFNSTDAGGLRSDLDYSWRAMQNSLWTFQSMSLYGGLGNLTAPELKDLCQRVNIGVTDVLYKAKHGYMGFEKGNQNPSPMTLTDNDTIFGILREMWLKVINNPYGAVEAVNAAADLAAMRAALTSPDLGLVLAGYDSLATDEKRDNVVQAVIDLKPAAGYTIKQDIQDIVYAQVKIQKQPVTETGDIEAAVNAVNTAADQTEMCAAIENTALGLNLAEYNSAPLSGRKDVARVMLNNRPGAGYENIGAIAAEFNSAVIVLPQTIFGNDSIILGKIDFVDEGVPYENGFVFQSNISGKIISVRIYGAGKEDGSEKEEGEHIARIWRNSDNTIIGGPYTFEFEGAGAWVAFDLPAPVLIEADVEYTISISTGEGPYFYYSDSKVPGLGFNNGRSLSWPVRTGVWTDIMGECPAEGTVQNYLRDVVFVADDPAPIVVP